MMYKHKLVDFLIHFMQEIDKVDFLSSAMVFGSSSLEKRGQKGPKVALRYRKLSGTRPSTRHLLVSIDVPLSAPELSFVPNFFGSLIQ